MTPDSWIQLAIALVGSGLLLGFIKGTWRIGKKVSRILSEVTPNGGASMNDRVCRLEKTQTEQTKILKEIKHHFQIPTEESQ